MSLNIYRELMYNKFDLSLHPVQFKYAVNSIEYKESYLLYILELGSKMPQLVPYQTYFKGLNLFIRQITFYSSYIPLEDYTFLLQNKSALDKGYIHYFVCRNLTSYFKCYILYNDMLKANSILTWIKPLFNIFSMFYRDCHHLDLDLIKSNIDNNLYPYLKSFCLLIDGYIKRDIVSTANKEYIKKFLEKEHNFNELYYHSRRILEDNFTKHDMLLLNYFEKRFRSSFFVLHMQILN